MVSGIMMFVEDGMKKAGLMVLLQRLRKIPHLPERSIKVTIGFWLLLLNVPVGYGVSCCMAVLAWLYARFSGGQNLLLSSRFVGGGIYALSWVMLGAGVWLVGPQNARAVRYALRFRFLAWRRQRRLSDIMAREVARRRCVSLS